MIAFYFLVFGALLQSGVEQGSGTSATGVIAAPSVERLLVKPKPGINLAAIHDAFGGRLQNHLPAIADLQIVEVPAGVDADALKSAYEQSGLIEYAEPDHVVHALADPNDFHFLNGDLWHLNNVGQYGGVVDADIDATDAW